MGISSFVRDEIRISPHLGARVSLNLDESWGLMGSARGNKEFVIGDMGILIRL
ncbi:hypothetical protein WDW86_04435 [Bdellovibrionota bacterium FG-2]